VCVAEAKLLLNTAAEQPQTPSHTTCPGNECKGLNNSIVIYIILLCTSDESYPAAAIINLTFLHSKPLRLCDSYKSYKLTIFFNSNRHITRLKPSTVNGTSKDKKQHYKFQ